jgi:preprotein translocase subunit SecY
VSQEPWRRIGFTLGALPVWWIGTYIQVPGIDPTALE